MTKVNTYLADQIELSELKAKYDLEAKKLLASKQILSRILKYTAKEFSDYSFEEIMDCIEGDAEISTVPLKPGKHRRDSITGGNLEDKVKEEGEVYYDLRFYAVTKYGERIKILFNVEAQKTTYPGYVLEHRSVFYAARMISSQLEQEFVIPNYDDIKKVYSIWICMEPSKKLANTIVEYHMTEHEIYGSVNRNGVCDLLSVVMIRLNADSTEEEQTHSLIGMLDILFSQKISVAERKNKLSQIYGLTMTGQIEGGMSDMCNLSDLIVERGLAEGIEKGMEKGMEIKTIEIALSMLQAGEPEDKIMLYTGLTLDEIEDIKPKKL